MENTIRCVCVCMWFFVCVVHCPCPCVMRARQHGPICISYTFKVEVQQMESMKRIKQMPAGSEVLMGFPISNKNLIHPLGELRNYSNDAWCVVVIINIIFTIVTARVSGSPEFGLISFRATHVFMPGLAVAPKLLIRTQSLVASHHSESHYFE